MATSGSFSSPNTPGQTPHQVSPATSAYVRTVNRAMPNGNLTFGGSYQSQGASSHYISSIGREEYQGSKFNTPPTKDPSQSLLTSTSTSSSSARRYVANLSCLCIVLTGLHVCKRTLGCEIKITYFQ